jgi:hypothetical protein
MEKALQSALEGEPETWAIASDAPVNIGASAPRGGPSELPEPQANGRQGWHEQHIELVGQCDEVGRRHPVRLRRGRPP